MIPGDGGGVAGESLEFDVVLRLVSSLARTPPGRAAILRLGPADNEDDVRGLLAETSEVAAFQIRHGRLPLAGLDEVAPVLDALERSGGAGGPEDFRPIVRAARAVEAVCRELGKAEGPRLSERLARLPLLGSLIERASRLFGPDGLVSDDASPELSSLRRRLRRRRAEVSRRLEKLLEERREIVGDAVVVLRNDRYCLPVLASARSRMPGIVHDRSGSGHSVFIEPIEVIEANNDLALAAAEERREVERLLSDFGREVLSQAEPLEAAVAELAELDAVEAKVAFGEMGQGRLPEISEDGGWTLVGARHPLLDARFEPLRRQVLPESRGGRDAVPLDLDLPAGRRLLIVSGPNAGGKTVVLKTAGLFSLLAQSGIPVPAAPGTRLPVFRSIRTEIGDAQAILSDRSTFSSSMETLAGILREAGPGSLALVDEMGGATDPEEGSALATAFLEAYLARGGRAIITTHLSAIKSFAGTRDDSLGAAMEFDEKTGRPSYRIHLGLSGRSRALAVAREQGIPDAVLERARQILGDAWQRRERAETEAEEALERLRASEEELARARARAAEEAERLAAEREKLARDKARMLEEGLKGFDRARAELARRVEAELDSARGEARLAHASATRLLEEAASRASSEPVVAEARDAERERSRSVEVGGLARVRGLGTQGTVASFDADWATLEIGGKRMRVRRQELEPVATRAAPAPSPRPKRGSVTAPARDLSAPTLEVHVIGRRLDEAADEVEKALDRAILEGAGRVLVVHGHGSGRLREGLRDRFRAHPAVASLRAADAREGGNGATILELR